MRNKNTRTQFIASAITLGLLLLITTAFVLYGMGYRLKLNFQQAGPFLLHTGILNVTSTPLGAQIYVNGHLTTASNNSVNLTPGKYTISLKKDGYMNWQKDVQIEDQVVTNVVARLFPVAPTLQSISSVGITNPVLDPSGTKLAFTVASQSAKNGIYILDMTNRSFPVLPVQSSSTQIADEASTAIPFSQAQIAWSPDGQTILASVSANLASPSTYLLKTDSINTDPQDVTATLPSLQATWQQQEADKTKARLAALKPATRDLIKHFSIISWSPDETKILYEAKDTATLPIITIPRRIGNNLLYEQRNVKQSGIYVYDITEDVNTKILDQSPVSCDVTQLTCGFPLTWFPDSFHLLYVYNHSINFVEDDGANMTTIYAGPFEDHYVFPWPDGSKIVIITNLNNTTIPPTLYTISLQ